MAAPGASPYRWEFTEDGREHVEAGDLVPVLVEYSTAFPGFYLYYPNRRHTSPALRAFIDYLLEMRRRST